MPSMLTTVAWSSRASRALDRPCECLGTSPCGERKLVWCAGGVKRSAEGLGQRAGEEPAEGVAEHEAPDASVAFTQGDHSAEAKGVENRGWDRCIDEFAAPPDGVKRDRPRC